MLDLGIFLLVRFSFIVFTYLSYVSFLRVLREYVFVEYVRILVRVLGRPKIRKKAPEKYVRIKTRKNNPPPWGGF